MKKLNTILKLATIESNLEVSEEVFDKYQYLLKLIQRTCVQLILSKDAVSVLLKGVYSDEKCISLEILGNFDLPKFTLNVYLFQFATFSNNKAVDTIELNIGADEDDGHISSLIRDAIFFKKNALLIGVYSEKLIAATLTEMKNERKILSFFKSSHMDDIMGVDYYFCMRNYKNAMEEIPLQVKSSEASQKRHEGKFSKIPSVVVSTESSKEDLKNKIIKIGEAYTAYRKQILHL